MSRLPSPLLITKTSSILPLRPPMEQLVAEEVEADDTSVLEKLKIARDNIAAIVASSSELNQGLVAVDRQLSLSRETCVAASNAVAPLQSQSIAAKALQSRINRAVSPALSVIHCFSLVETIQRRLLDLSSNPVTDKPNQSRLLRYIDCVDELNSAIGTVVEGCEPAIMKLQEAVEFLNRTKATDQLRIHRLRETLAVIKALYEEEVDSMKYEGVLDEALLRLQDDYEGILQQIKHQGISDGSLEFDGLEDGNLGTDSEIEILRRISETLASNDCLDICIDIYVKVRYRRAAKALMRLKPTYLKTYVPEELDKMEWETLESAITLWMEHFQLAVKVVFIGEKNLSCRVLSGIMDGAVWPECFAKIADKIMAVFFRFGEGVARSSKEPQKLFKLLDMYDSMDRTRAEFMLVFDVESGTDICTRFRELQKLLVDTTCKVFWEFGLQIEGLQDLAPPPVDGSVPNIVRYAVNYLKCLSANGYGATMEQVLQTERTWKGGHAPDESLLEEAVSNAMDALQRNVETKRTRYKDKIVANILGMNTYWYMYMRTKGSELAKLVGEDNMKKKYKMAAEEAAYNYQAQAWGPLVKVLSESSDVPSDEITARGKMDVFIRELEEILRRHGSSYCVPDEDLREQIKDAVAQLVIPAYAGFLNSCSGVKLGRVFPKPDAIRELLCHLFDRGSQEGSKSSFKSRLRRFDSESGGRGGEESEGRVDTLRGGRFRGEPKKQSEEEEGSVESEYTERDEIERRISMGSRQSGFEDNFGRRRFKNYGNENEERVMEKIDGRVRKEGMRREIEEDKVGSFGRRAMAESERSGNRVRGKEGGQTYVKRRGEEESVGRRVVAERENPRFGRRELKIQMEGGSGTIEGKEERTNFRRRGFRASVED